MSIVNDGYGATMHGAIVSPASSFKAVSNTIRAAFNDNLTIGQSIPTQFPNVNFDPPDDAVWCRMDILFAESAQRTLGAGTPVDFRTPGILQVQVFGPGDAGDNAILQAADKIASQFRAQTYNGVTFRTPSVRTVGQEGRWHRIDVLAPFFFNLRE